MDADVNEESPLGRLTAVLFGGVSRGGSFAIARCLHKYVSVWLGWDWDWDWEDDPK